MRSAAILSVVFAAIGIQAAPMIDSADSNESQTQAQATAAKSPYLTVKTEDGLTWSRAFPDELADLAMYYYDTTPINVTCWIPTTMRDSKGRVQGDGLWLGMALPSGYQDTAGKVYINEEYVKGANIDFKSKLTKCPAVTHGVGLPLDSYCSSTTYNFNCYSKPSLNSTVAQTPGCGYFGIACYKLGGQSVNGNTTWAQLQDSRGYAQKCYVPGGDLTPSEYHGTAGLC